MWQNWTAFRVGTRKASSTIVDKTTFLQPLVRRKRRKPRKRWRFEGAQIASSSDDRNVWEKKVKKKKKKKKTTKKKKKRWACATLTRFYFFRCITVRVVYTSGGFSWRNFGRSRRRGVDETSERRPSAIAKSGTARVRERRGWRGRGEGEVRRSRDVDDDEDAEDGCETSRKRSPKRLHRVRGRTVRTTIANASSSKQSGSIFCQPERTCDQRRIRSIRNKNK